MKLPKSLVTCRHEMKSLWFNVFEFIDLILDKATFCKIIFSSKTQIVCVSGCFRQGFQALVSVVSSELWVPTSMRVVYIIQLMKNKGHIKASIIISFCKDRIRERQRDTEREKERERHTKWECVSLPFLYYKEESKSLNFCKYL